MNVAPFAGVTACPLSAKAPAMRVAIVGAGYSGTIAAVEIASAAPGASIVLIEKSGRFAQGAAYGTTSPGHLLNVRARNMSALARDPDHFAGWAADEGYGSDDYVPRRDYRRYLAGLLDGAAGVERVTGAAVAVEDGAIALESGERFECEAAILAGGNFPSRLPAEFGPGAIHDPWGPQGAEALDRAAARGGELLLVGTGLTMVDMAVSLEEAGFAGRITACSRRGLVPRAHVSPPAAALDWEPPARLGDMVRAVRARTPWRSSVDGLRPHSIALWQGLEEAEQRRFLRHLRPWWDVHRHRIAPAVAARIEAMRCSGRLEVAAGRIVRVEGEKVTIARRGGGELRRSFGAIINCTGPEGDIRRVGDPLIRGLLASGRARPDRLGLGLEVGRDSRVAGGGPSPALYAVGPLSRGAFWEIIAVPDIREQVAGVAKSVLRCAGSTGSPATQDER
ncbi:MAG TPA: FAD/NAD(P)-binding protein [Allosphingosinicella sp.]|nr:FAD/NAD(P)-binding protein [Allosphingosinicella sp.]